MTSANWVKTCFDMMEAHFFVTIDSWGKCRLSTVPLKTGNDGSTAGLPQALGADQQYALNLVQVGPIIVVHNCTKVYKTAKIDLE